VTTKEKPAFLQEMSAFPNSFVVLSKLLEIWPEHVDYCKARFAEHDKEFEGRMDELSALIIANTGEELGKYCADYRWMCEKFLEEEIHFRRHGEYRLSTFQAAYDEVYGNDEYMAKYVRGILISQLVWHPHAKAFDFFRTRFLPLLPDNSNYLEVGPGHGLFLYFAAQCENLSNLEAWDVSQSSIRETHSALKKLSVTREISIVEQDVLKAPSRSNEFDGAVISEVLEHLEQPELALRSLHEALKPGGRIFINAPINSPAPDHIYLWRSVEEFSDFVKEQGFEIELSANLPVTGAALDIAIKRQLSISCIIIGRKPN